MTSNQQLMSILSNVGEHKQLKDTTIILGCLLGAAVITAIVLLPKYTEAIRDNNRLRFSNMEYRSAVYSVRSELELSNAENQRIAKRANQMEKENIQLKNDRIGQAKA